MPTTDQIAEMRGFVADCTWRDLDAGDVDQLTDDEIVEGVNRHYAGGTTQFIKDVV